MSKSGLNLSRQETFSVRKLAKWAVIFLLSMFTILAIGFWILIHEIRTEFFSTLESSRRPDWVTMDALPRPVIQAVLASEGQDFFGCNKFSYLKGLWDIVVAGGITDNPKPNCNITNQVVKDVLSRQPRGGMGSWHLRGAVAIYAIHSRLSNRQIFEEYANRVYVGKGRQGLSDGADLLFRKPLSKLTSDEAAELAAILKGPEYYSKRPDYIQQRKAYILQAIEKGEVDTDSGKQ